MTEAGGAGWEGGDGRRTLSWQAWRGDLHGPAGVLSAYVLRSVARYRYCSERVSYDRDESGCRRGEAGRFCSELAASRAVGYRWFCD